MKKQIPAFVLVIGCSAAAWGQSIGATPEFLGQALGLVAAIAAFLFVPALILAAFWAVPRIAAARARHHDHLIPATRRSYRARRA